MNKGELMANIISILRGKSKAYRKDQIEQSVKAGFDKKEFDSAFHTLVKEQILTEKLEIFSEEEAQFFYALPFYYRIRLKDAPQTESIKECYSILFPNEEKELVQAELFKN